MPGHVHLKDLGQLVAREIEAAGGVAKEFNTIAVDDGIAMGHDGMLYSLPSRELIADSVEYMVNAHCADAIVCISNCDKITPGMLMAALRLNIPAVFVSGGPMEAGKVHQGTACPRNSISSWRNDCGRGRQMCPTKTVAVMERSACPTCGSCSGMFTANSDELSDRSAWFVARGQWFTTLATHADSRQLFVECRSHTIVEITKQYYEKNDASVLPRSIATFEAFENVDGARCCDGRINEHRVAFARGRARSRRELHHEPISIACRVKRAGVVQGCRPVVSHVHMEDVHRAGGIMGILGELDRGGLLHREAGSIHAGTLGRTRLERWDMQRTEVLAVHDFYRAAPGGVPTQVAFSQDQSLRQC